MNADGKFNDASGDSVKYLFPTAGIHLVSMRIYFLSGAVKTKIHQVPVGDYPKIKFSYTGVCSPNTLTKFTDSTSLSEGSIVSRFWDYGDGQTENRPNIYAYHNVCPGFTELFGVYLGGGSVPGGGTVIDTVNIMSVFTPNGDGFNDKWVVQSAKITKPFAVWVYNCAGKPGLSFQSKHFRN